MAKVYDEARLAKLVGEEQAKRIVKSTTGSITVWIHHPRLSFPYHGATQGIAQFMSLSVLDEHARAFSQHEMQDEPTVEEPPSLIPLDPEVDEQPSLPADSPLHDLESFVWVLLYALCIKEMNSKPSVSERGAYCARYFMDIFGTLSFRETLERHTFIMSRITRNGRSDKAWKRECISDSNAMLVLQNLMQVAKTKALDYEKFKEILFHYIGQLEPTNTVPPTL